MILKQLPRRLAALLVAACSAVTADAQVLPVNNDVVLYMNVATGATRIQNDGATPINIDAYQITTTTGDTMTSLLDSSGWSPLDTEPSLVGSAETASPEEPWDVLSSNAQSLVEANRTSNLTLNPGESQSIGNVLTTDFAFLQQHQTNVGGFGNPYLTGFNEFVFIDDDANVRFQGDIVYEEVLLNDLVLEVNTATGATTFKNESTLGVTIDFIEILSDGGNGNSLNPTGFTGIDGVPGLNGDWQFDPTNNSVSAIREFFPGDGTSPDQGEEFLGRTEAALGDVFSAGSGEEDLSFLVHFVGETGTYAGQVRYVTAVGQDGDYNGDTLVNAADYAVYRDGASPNGLGTLDDYNTWAANFGATSAAVADSASVPEPSCAGLLLIALAASCGAVRTK